MNSVAKPKTKSDAKPRKPVNSLRLKAQRYDILLRDLREFIKKYECLLQLTKENK